MITPRYLKHDNMIVNVCMFKLLTRIDLAVHCSCLGVELGTNMKVYKVSQSALLTKIERGMNNHNVHLFAFHNSCGDFEKPVKWHTM